MATFISFRNKGYDSQDAIEGYNSGKKYIKNVISYDRYDWFIYTIQSSYEK